MARASVAVVLLAVASLSESVSAHAPNPGPGASRAKPSVGGVVAIDTKTNRIVRKFRILRPNVVALSPAAAWVTDNVRNVVWIWRLGHLPQRPRRAIRVGSPRTMIPDDLAVGGGSLWMLRGSELVRYDIHTGGQRSARALPPGGLATAVAFDAGAVWTLDATRGWVSRISADTDRVTAQVKLTGPKTAMAVAGGNVWVSSGSAGTVEQLAERTLRVRRTVRIAGAGQIAADAAGAWVVSPSRNRLTRIEARSGAMRWIRIPGATSVATAGNTAWVVASAARTLVRIDAARLSVVARIALPRRPYWVAAGAARVWVTYLGRNIPSEVGE